MRCCPATVQVETEKRKKKKKTQLGLVEQVSSRAAMTRVGDKQPGWRVRKETLSWPVVLVLCAEKKVYVWQKNGKGSGREGSGTGSEGSEKVRTRTMGRTFTRHELSLRPNPERTHFCLSQFYCVLCQCV